LSTRAGGAEGFSQPLAAAVSVITGTHLKSHSQEICPAEKFLLNFHEWSLFIAPERARTTGPLVFM
jgi:hypothetical protein